MRKVVFLSCLCFALLLSLGISTREIPTNNNKNADTNKNIADPWSQKLWSYSWGWNSNPNDANHPYSWSHSDPRDQNSWSYSTPSQPGQPYSYGYGWSGPYQPGSPFPNQNPYGHNPPNNPGNGNGPPKQPGPLNGPSEKQLQQQLPWWTYWSYPWWNNNWAAQPGGGPGGEASPAPPTDHPHDTPKG
ncbi:hypothetical protein ACH5RR_039747 [Cinchona calisaya]|uniref:Uncharacterized protein n=1 Tax=Cinchona calisaya TaxID=153742 RepID=A0ABD2XZ66_9GENT